MAPKPSPSRIFTLTLLILSLPVSISAGCYYPNGTDVNRHYDRDRYLPCRHHSTTSTDDVDTNNSTTTASMCCRLRGGGDPDTCRPDGLCQAADGTLYRESCTDRNWQAKDCVQLCADGGEVDAGDWPIQQCADGSFCCDMDAEGQRCCEEGRGRWIGGDGRALDVEPAVATTVRGGGGGGVAATGE